MENRLKKINEWFGELTPTIIKYRWWIIVIAVAIISVQIIGVTRMQFVNSNDSWLLENDPIKLAQDDFEEIFGNDEAVLVLLEAEDVFSHDALQVNRTLCKAFEKEVPLADDIFSLTDIDFTRASADGIEVGQLVPEQIPQNTAELEEIRKQAMTKEYLVDRLFSRDSTATLIIIDLKPYPKGEDAAKLDLEYQIKITHAAREIVNRPEYSDYRITLGGVPVMVEGEMRWAAAEMESVMGLTLLIMIVVLALSFRSIVAVIAPIATAAFSMIFVMGFFGWFGIEVQELILIIPLLLALVLSVGYNVHILSFFQQKRNSGATRAKAIQHALGQAAWPILFTVITTAIGLLSFMVVPIVSIRFAGMSSAGLLLFCYPLVVLLTPALLSFGKEKAKEVKREKLFHIENSLEMVGRFTENNKILIVSIFAVITIGFAAAIPFLEVDTDYTRTMGTEVPYIADGMHIADSIGSLYSYELLFNFGSPDSAKNPENLKNIQRLGDELKQFETFKRYNAVTDIVKDLNRIMHEGKDEYYRIPEDKALTSQLLFLYEMSGGTETEDWIDYDYQRARMQVELGDFTSKDVEAQLDYISEHENELTPNGEIIISGLAATFAKVVNYMVTGQIWSIGIALIVISVVMMLVFGNVKLGLIGMIPNITPVILSLGTMSFLETPLHMMTMMVAPMVIGIAVDDTIHFISHFRREFQATGSYVEANRLTFRSVGKAVLLTSLVICLGFAAFLPSQLLAYHHVGLYTIIAILGALLADYFVTPVLIMWTRPFGKEKA
jgi:hydrophobe/amphiphile efflux-3 (HAE3) family protein